VVTCSLFNDVTWPIAVRQHCACLVEVAPYACFSSCNCNCNYICQPWFSEMNSFSRHISQSGLSVHHISQSVGYNASCVRLTSIKTRMVQLPATAAIEYVAACCRTRTRTRTKTGTKTKTGTITKTVRGAYARSPKFNAYTHRLGFLCLSS